MSWFRLRVWGIVIWVTLSLFVPCLLYTSDAADERSSVDLGGRRIINKKTTMCRRMIHHDEIQKKIL